MMKAETVTEAAIIVFLSITAPAIAVVLAASIRLRQRTADRPLYPFTA